MEPAGSDLRRILGTYAENYAHKVLELRWVIRNLTISVLHVSHCMPIWILRQMQIEQLKIYKNINLQQEKQQGGVLLMNEHKGLVWYNMEIKETH